MFFFNVIVKNAKRKKKRNKRKLFQKLHRIFAHLGLFERWTTLNIGVGIINYAIDINRSMKDFSSRTVVNIS